MECIQMFPTLNKSELPFCNEFFFFTLCKILQADILIHFNNSHVFKMWSTSFNKILSQ